MIPGRKNQIHHKPLRFHDLRGIRGNDHALLHRRRARRMKSGAPLHFHQARPAFPARADFFVIAERGNVQPIRPRGLQNCLVWLDRIRLTVHRYLHTFLLNKTPLAFFDEANAVSCANRQDLFTPDNVLFATTSCVKAFR